MKKLINDPANTVAQTVAGMALAHPDLIVASTQDDALFIRRAQSAADGKVGLVSGGGSGHEPLHGGFVGSGMLDAAVPGPMFTSPTPEPIVAAIKEADTGAGVLLIVKNYTGDVLNFETAAELAELDGHQVSTVVVDDDVAVPNSTHTAGRRGVAGTVLVEKVAGAAAERGQDLTAVTRVAELAIASVRSMGVALRAGTLPHAESPSFTLEADEIEIGIGIHGEPGRARVPAASADAVTAELLQAIAQDLELGPADDVILLVNGMGGTPLSELYIVTGSAHAWLEQRGVRIARTLVGNYVTSLEMQGASITVMRAGAELLEYYDAPVITPSLRWGG